MSVSLYVSVIICSLDGYRKGNVPRLLKQLAEQSLLEFEILIIQGFAPCSKAHNEGALRAKGEILVFFDDDIQLGNGFVVENLVKVINLNKGIGMVGASQLIPEDSTLFQKRCARELYRIEFPVVAKLMESDMATHVALAIKKQLYDEVGGEREELLRNDDVYLRSAVGQKNFKIVIAPDTWVYHPQPLKITQLLKRQFNNGVAIAHDYKYFSEYIYYSPLDGDRLKFPQKSSFHLQIFRNLKIILSYLVRLRFLGLLSRLIMYLGFFWGFIHKKNWFKKWLIMSKGVEEKTLRYQKKSGSIIFVG